MPRVCQVTGAAPGFGHHVSHSHRRTKRRFNVNIQAKRYWAPSLNRHVSLTVSAGPGNAVVPSTAGLPREEATRLLD